jgi:NADH dehydrogenase FAD-containing subunit
LPRLLQVVVLGASETGLAALEQLLLHPALEFTSLTLVAPGGLHGARSPGPYCPALLARLALDTRVVVLPGRAVGLDRGQRLVQLESGALVPYDLLLLATGLQVRGGGA